MKNFGDRLRELRKEKKMSLEKLASYFGLGKNATSSWETGKSKPSSDDLVILAELLETTPNYLLLGVSDRYNQVVVEKSVWEAKEAEIAYLKTIISLQDKNSQLKNTDIIFNERQLTQSINQ